MSECQIESIPSPYFELDFLSHHFLGQELADMASTGVITAISSEQDGVYVVNKVDESKDRATGVVEVMDVEEGETQKTVYSKLSVVMMVIFSGLAIGSDG